MPTCKRHCGQSWAGAQGSRKGFETSVRNATQTCVCVSSINTLSVPTQKHPRNLILCSTIKIYISYRHATQSNTHKYTGALMPTYYKHSYLLRRVNVVMLELEPTPVQKALKPTSVTFQRMRLGLRAPRPNPVLHKNLIPPSVTLSRPMFVCQQSTRSAPTQCIPPNLILHFRVNIYSSYIHRSTSRSQTHGFSPLVLTANLHGGDGWAGSQGVTKGFDTSVCDVV